MLKNHENNVLSLSEIEKLEELLKNPKEDLQKIVSIIQEKVEERILKETIHELGHTFGLKHCHNNCVMRFSNSLADTDKKPVKFCASCLKQLKTSI